MGGVNSADQGFTKTERLVFESLTNILEIIDSGEITLDKVRELFGDQLFYLVTGDSRGLLPELRLDEITVAEFWNPVSGKKMIENPLQFVERVYAPWIGKGLTKWHIGKIDEKLYRSLENWSRKEENIIPETVLPTKRPKT